MQKYATWIAAIVPIVVVIGTVIITLVLLAPKTKAPSRVHVSHSMFSFTGRRVETRPTNAQGNEANP